MQHAACRMQGFRTPLDLSRPTYMFTLENTISDPRTGILADTGVVWAKLQRRAI